MLNGQWQACHYKHIRATDSETGQRRGGGVPGGGSGPGGGLCGSDLSGSDLSGGLCGNGHSGSDPSDGLCGQISYRDAAHARLPHVVKFSGGRSSGAMAVSLARSGALDPSRGDVVLFANTTAEHPATYEFAARVCEELESNHGLPCLWYEFCTVEALTRSGWSRVASFRLVRRVKASPDDDPAAPGYHDDGTAFEEMVSRKTMIPNRSLRFCTQQLKVLPGIEVLSYWLGGGPGPAHAGHFYGGRLASAVADAERYSGSAMTVAEYEAARGFAHGQPPSRPAQRWSDFTSTPTRRPSDGPRPKADLAGRHGPPVGYVTLMGLRADERARVMKAQMAEVMYGGATTAQCRHESHPAGEVIVAPLADHGADKQDVCDFWAEQPYDLELDRDGRWGNCVYCFMKGEPALRRMAAAESDENPPLGPAGIRWWADIEARYGRRSDNPQDAGKTFKFLSLRSASYSDIAAGQPNGRAVRGGGGEHAQRRRPALRLHGLIDASALPMAPRGTQLPGSKRAAPGVHVQ